MLSAVYRAECQVEVKKERKKKMKTKLCRGEKEAKGARCGTYLRGGNREEEEEEERNTKWLQRPLVCVYIRALFHNIMYSSAQCMRMYRYGAV